MDEWLHMHSSFTIVWNGNASRGVVTLQRRIGIIVGKMQTGAKLENLVLCHAIVIPSVYNYTNVLSANVINNNRNTATV